MKTEYGTVKMFDTRKHKKFGFISVIDEHGKETGEEIFFHLNDREMLEVTSSGPSFAMYGEYPSGRCHIMRAPRRGDEIAFVRQRSSQDNRYKACPWSFCSHPDFALELNPDDDYYDERDEICDGICGQPAYACTCAETESFRSFQSDPATAGSYWVA